MKIVDINGSEREVKEAYPDPEYPGFMKIVFKRHHEWYSIREFLQFNPDKKGLTQNAPELAEDFVGRVTSSGKDYIKDTALTLEDNNQYLGFHVWISRGKGEGQVREIVKHNHNTLHVDKEWDEKPNKTSQYVVTSNEQHARAMGNTLPTEDMKEFEKMAFDMDLKRGRINKNLKYVKKLPTELD